MQEARPLILFSMNKYMSASEISLNTSITILCTAVQLKARIFK